MSGLKTGLGGGVPCPAKGWCRGGGVPGPGLGVHLSGGCICIMPCGGAGGLKGDVQLGRPNGEL